MKKYRLIFLVVVLGVLGYFVFTLMSKKKSSLSSESLSEFSIKDTATIDRLRISSNAGGMVDFVKKNGGWSFKEGGCAQQHMIHNFLETIKYIAVKAPVPAGGVENVNKQILSQHKKVEIFQNGKLSKTWFIGTSTADHYGTNMILKIEGKGISPEPFITFQPNVYGNLADQFSLRKKDYECSAIFSYENLLDIKKIDVTVHEDSSSNFEIISIDENRFELYSNGVKIERFDTTKVRGYITAFSKMHYTTKEPIIPKEIRDSTIASTPYYTIRVTDKKGITTSIVTHLKDPIKIEYDYDGNLITTDRNNLYALIRDDVFVQIQYFVFDKTFRNLEYFRPNE
ncbi:MAG: hypothetical protein AB8B72_03675 [Crocinitomicaceae bacterium]